MYRRDLAGGGTLFHTMVPLLDVQRIMDALDQSAA